MGGNLDYALARVYARQGQRLEEVGWRRLEASRDLGQYLAAARSTTLAEWVISFDAEHDCHTMERALRAQWPRHVKAVAAWHPRAWQEWLEWLAWLPFLSLLQQLARPESAPAWMLADPVCGPLAPGTITDRTAALAHTAIAPLEAVVAGRISPGAAWRAHWQALWPRADARTQDSRDLFLRTVDQNQQALLIATDTAEPLREQLAIRLQRLMRIAAGTVIVTLCHLALLALDLERLRGGLACRCLFGGNAVVR
jgi:hypothetical protein